jgi:hypothetical protein
MRDFPTDLYPMSGTDRKSLDKLAYLENRVVITANGWHGMTGICEEVPAVVLGHLQMSFAEACNRNARGIT